MKIVFLGLSLTSSWGNGHATTYRGLVKELAHQGHDVCFLERDVPWYAKNRDLPTPPWGCTLLYSTLEELQHKYREVVRGADCVVVGSYVPDGIALGQWVQATALGVKAFYDIDTPVTLAALERQECTYIAADQIARYDLYLSFAGGRALDILTEKFGSPCARPLYCSVDPAVYYPEKETEIIWDLGYLGTYSEDRQPSLQKMMLDAALAWPEGKFCVAGPQYPDSIAWPPHVARREHLPPKEHCVWYNSQRFTLNITRADMIQLGWSPSVRLFEAAACGVPILSDFWEGLDAFFMPDAEILITHSGTETLHILRCLPEAERREIGQRARSRILATHTAAHRALELEHYINEIKGQNVS